MRRPPSISSKLGQTDRQKEGDGNIAATERIQSDKLKHNTTQVASRQQLAYIALGESKAKSTQRVVDIWLTAAVAYPPYCAHSLVGGS